MSTPTRPHSTLTWATRRQGFPPIKAFIAAALLVALGLFLLNRLARATDEPTSAQAHVPGSLESMPGPREAPDRGTSSPPATPDTVPGTTAPAIARVAGASVGHSVSGNSPPHGVSRSSRDSIGEGVSFRGGGNLPEVAGPTTIQGARLRVRSFYEVEVLLTTSHCFLAKVARRRCRPEDIS